MGAVRDFVEKAAAFAIAFPDETVLPAFFSRGGFTNQAMALCKVNGIATAHEVRFSGVSEGGKSQ